MNVELLIMHVQETLSIILDPLLDNLAPFLSQQLHFENKTLRFRRKQLKTQTMMHK